MQKTVADILNFSNEAGEGSAPNAAAIQVYRLVLGALVILGSLMTIDIVWALVDFCMVIMTVCNLIAILLLGKYAISLLKDYRCQLKAGKEPVYTADVIPEIADETECW